MSSIFFIVVCLWIIYTAKVDAEHLNKQQWIDSHSSRLIVRGLTGCLVAIVSPVAGLVLGLLFWALFDTILNFLRGKPLLYIGSVAETDKFFKNKYKVLFASKVISLSIGIVLLAIYGL